jgi:hydrogenase nickel incorporation protein HypA/HybF
MHELAVTESILNIVIKHAARNRAEKVLSISLKIGELTDLVDEWMQRYFNYLSKDTVAEGAILKIERSPLVFQCSDCMNTFPVSLRDTGKITCSRCNGKKVVLVSGREFYIKHIEVV